MEDTTGTEIKEEKTDLFIYVNIFAIFVSIFSTVWCFSYGIIKLVNMEVLLAAFNIFLGAITGTFLIVNTTSFIKRRFKIDKLNKIVKRTQINSIIMSMILSVISMVFCTLMGIHIISNGNVLPGTICVIFGLANAICFGNIFSKLNKE